MLSKPDKETGKTRLKLLIEIRDQTGIIAPELKNLPQCPDEMAHVWKWFCDLSRARRAGFGLEAITWPDMQAYFSMMGISPMRWELEAIGRLDDSFITIHQGKSGMRVKGAKALKSAIPKQPTE